MQQIELSANKRLNKGTAATRRLRSGNKVPGIVYGGGSAEELIELDHQALFLRLRKAHFRANLVALELDGVKQTVLLRDIRFHPVRDDRIQHIDFQRVTKETKIHVKVPLRFINEAIAPGVKAQGGQVSHAMSEIEVRCLPDNLPDAIEVDLQHLTIGHAIHATQLKLPDGVQLMLKRGEDPPVASIPAPKAAVDEAAAAAAEGADATAATTTAAPAAAAAAAKAPAGKAAEKSAGKGDKK